MSPKIYCLLILLIISKLYELFQKDAKKSQVVPISSEVFFPFAYIYIYIFRDFFNNFALNKISILKKYIKLIFSGDYCVVINKYFKFSKNISIFFKYLIYFIGIIKYLFLTLLKCSKYFMIFPLCRQYISFAWKKLV